MKKFGIVSFICFVILSFSQLQAQNQYYYGGPQLGIYPKGLIIGGDLSYAQNKNIYSIGGMYAEAIEHPQKFKVFEVRYGRYHGHIWRFSYSAGISYLHGRNLRDGAIGDDLQIKINTIGLPAKISLCVVPLRYMSVSIDFYGNLNPHYTFGAILFRVSFGIIRD